MNENYAQPSMPDGVEDAIIRGLYRFRTAPDHNGKAAVRLLGSGAIFPIVIEAARILEAEFGVASEIWSVTSYSELAREAAAVERRNRLNPQAAPEESHVAMHLAGVTPIVAASDYVRAYPQLIAPYVKASFTTLGTDGFGRSDTRSALRRFFEVDAGHIVVAALHALADTDAVPRATAVCGHRTVRHRIAIAGAMGPLMTSGRLGTRVMVGVVEVKLPDIGDFGDVPVIEIHVKPGEVVSLTTRR